jgi:hypothetical protein
MNVSNVTMKMVTLLMMEIIMPNCRYCTTELNQNNEADVDIPCCHDCFEEHDEFLEA